MVYGDAMNGLYGKNIFQKYRISFWYENFMIKKLSMVCIVKCINTSDKSVKEVIWFIFTPVPFIEKNERLLLEKP